MSALNVAQATEEIYKSLHNDNEDIDIHIDNLKKALVASGKKQAVFAPARLWQNNREGRKTLQAYFRKRGVNVVFEKQPSN